MSKKVTYVCQLCRTEEKHSETLLKIVGIKFLSSPIQAEIVHAAHSENHLCEICLTCVCDAVKRRESERKTR